MKLHLGCGKNYLQGYINIDLPPDGQSVMHAKADVYEDIRGLKYPENSVDEIRNHHLLEHFTRQEALKLLLQWRRWLKPGGLLVIETPDFEEGAKLFPQSDLKRKFKLARHLFGSHESEWAIHRDFWSKEKFEFLLSQFGFEVIEVKQFNAVIGVIPKTSRLINKFPSGSLKEHLADQLPNIVVRARKLSQAVDERKAVKKILSLSLVGSEQSILKFWFQEVFPQ